MSQATVDVIKDQVEHDLTMQFTPSYYLLRDLLRIIAEKEQEEQFGISFGDPEFIHLHDKQRNDDLAMYSAYYAREYPKAVFYFWNGQELQKMERQPFFSILFQLKKQEDK